MHKTSSSQGQRQKETADIIHGAQHTCGVWARNFAHGRCCGCSQAGRARWMGIGVLIFADASHRE